jgi:hypothetical protein
MQWSAKSPGIATGTPRTIGACVGEPRSCCHAPTFCADLSASSGLLLSAVRMRDVVTETWRLQRLRLSRARMYPKLARWGSDVQSVRAVNRSGS